MSDEAKAVLQTLHETLGESITLTPADVVALGQLAHEREAAVIAHKVATWAEMVNALKVGIELFEMTDEANAIGTDSWAWVVNSRDLVVIAERLP